MTNEKLKSVFVEYRNFLNSTWPDISPSQMSPLCSSRTSDQIPILIQVAHFKFMCREAQLFVDSGMVEKAMRWLGFLQGSFWRTGFFTLDELKHHSMS